MLRNRFLAVAVAAALSSGPAWAEEQKSAAEASAANSAAETQVAVAKTDAEASSAASADASVTEAPKAAPAAKPAPLPTPTLTVKVDLAAQSMTVYQGGSVLHSWPISSGTATHPTPRGTFRPQWTAKMWYSRKYDNAPMPNAVFINGGVAIHATPYVSRLGTPASHGCIRLAPGNAKQFYSLVHKHGLKRVRVSVSGTPNYGAYASRKTQKTYAAAPEAAPSNDSGWSWLFGSPQDSAYNPQFIKPQQKQRAYLDKRTNRIYYKKNGKRIYVQQKPKPQKPKYSSYSSNSFGSNW